MNPDARLSKPAQQVLLTSPRMAVVWASGSFTCASQPSSSPARCTLKQSFIAYGAA